MPRHLQLAISSDEELTKVLAEATISEGGVSSNINPFLFPKYNAKGKVKKEKDAHGTQEI